MVFCLAIISENCNAHTNTGVITGCIEGSGNARTEQRQVVFFNAINVSGAFDVYVECQQKQNVEITTDDNILPHITTKVRGQTLYITSNRSICPKSQLDINISIDNVEDFASSGASDVSISDINNKKLVMTLEGVGDIDVSGKTREFVIDVSGAVEIDAKGLLSEEVRISSSGAAEAVVHASKRLQIDISGVGDIYYYGNPEEIIEDISGVGEIIKK